KNDVNMQIAEELSKGLYADQTKLARLRARLAYEDAENKKAVADAEATYNTDIANAKEQHDTKLADLQAALDKEMALQQKYAQDFATYRDYVIKDDITKLKEGYARQEADRKLAYEKRITDIIENGKESAAQQATNGTNDGLAYGGGIAGGLNKSMAGIPDQL